MQTFIDILIWPAVALVVLTAGWWFATRKRAPGKKRKGGGLIAVAVLLGIGHVIDPPQERAVEATNREEKDDEKGEPPLKE